MIGRRCRGDVVQRDPATEPATQVPHKSSSISSQPRIRYLARMPAVEFGDTDLTVVRPFNRRLLACDAGCRCQEMVHLLLVCGGELRQW